MVKTTVQFQGVGFTYPSLQTNPRPALSGIDLTMESGQVTAIIGQTGSGKTTLMQLLAGLQSPQQGQIKRNEVTIDRQATPKQLDQWRQGIGYVFQFPEKQLFAETVLDDVMFGPLNLGLAKADARQQAIKSLQQVKVDPKLFDQSPFELSGGQQRRVAIAGVLAMQPQVLILDEPSVGLDPKGQHELVELIQTCQQQEMLIVMITHDMELVAQVANQVVVLTQGKVATITTPRELFEQAEQLATWQLSLPTAVQLAHLARQSGAQLQPLPLTMEQLATQLATELEGHDAN
ncbi:MAG: ATP-binding cassette domain-containing protein [Limosilactobacillus sp.]|nr:ATP-binding cassette domain-containing protein [Limosilactobacillus sp.]